MRGSTIVVSCGVVLGSAAILPAGHVKDCSFSVNDSLLDADPKENATFSIAGRYQVDAVEVALGSASFTAKLIEDDTVTNNDEIHSDTVTVPIPGGTSDGDCVSYSHTFGAFNPSDQDEVSDPCFFVCIDDGDFWNEYTGTIETDTENAYPNGVPNPVTVSDQFESKSGTNAHLMLTGDQQEYHASIGESFQVPVLVQNFSESPQLVTITSGILPGDDGPPGFTINPPVTNVGPIPSGQTAVAHFMVQKNGVNSAMAVLQAQFQSNPSTQDSHLILLGDGVQIPAVSTTGLMVAFVLMAGCCGYVVLKRRPTMT